MRFVAEVKSGGFRTKMVKDGPAVSITEVRLLVDSTSISLDELSTLKNQPVNVDLSKVQIAFGDQAVQQKPQTEIPGMKAPKTTSKIKRKTVLRD